MTTAWRPGPASPPTHWLGSFRPVSPSMADRAAMPCLNSSGKEAKEASSTPSARNPLWVNATVTQRVSTPNVARAVAADATRSQMARIQARPDSGSRNDRNS